MNPKINPTRTIILIFVLYLCLFAEVSAQTRFHQFNPLPQQWDEAMPLGNGMIGSLVWEKEKVVRFALDRADLWDSRPL